MRSFHEEKSKYDLNERMPQTSARSPASSFILRKELLDQTRQLLETSQGALQARTNSVSESTVLFNK
jgi:hypothetical protein